MQPFEIGPARPVGAVQAKTIAPAAAVEAPAAPAAADAASAAPQVQTSAAVKAGEAAPVDGERVATIRRAIQDGHYPVIPTRIADAMIAAGMLLRSSQ